MTRLSLDIPKEFHQELKMFATYKKTSIKDFVIDTLAKQIKSEFKPYISKNIPNEETVRTLEESQKNLNLNPHNSKQDFFDYLNNLQKEADEELAKENK